MKTVSFVRRKFMQMLAVATLTMSVNYIVMLSASVIVGNLVGGAGLAGVNTCTPVFGMASFLASLLSVGTSLVFSRAMGAFDERRANRIFSQSMTLAIAMGALIFVAMRLGETAFFDFTGVTGEVLAQAKSYWRWQSFAMAITPAVLTMESLIYADGDVALASLAGAVHVLGSLGLSVLFTMLTGNAGGTSAGTALTMCVVLSVCCLHLFRKNNHLRWVSGFSMRDLRETIVTSLADSTIYLCWGVLIMIVNKFSVVRFGQELLPVVALAASVVEFSIVFDGVGEALIPIGGMYDGEGNRLALRELAGHSALVATLEGMFFGLVFYLLSPVIVEAYGIRGDAAALTCEAISAVKILALAMPFMGLLMMANTHFLVVHHTAFAVSVTVIKDFVCPCLGALIFGFALGSKGLWIGFSIGYALAAAYPFLFVLWRHGRQLFPWLVPGDDGKSLNFAIRLTKVSSSDASVKIAEFLNDSGVFDTAVGAIARLVDEMGLTTLAENARPVVVEYFVTLENPDCVRLIIRDTGKSENLNPKVPAASAASESRYLNTLGCNRTVYRFDITGIK